MLVLPPSGRFEFDIQYGCVFQYEIQTLEVLYVVVVDLICCGVTAVVLVIVLVNLVPVDHDDVPVAPPALAIRPALPKRN